TTSLSRGRPAHSKMEMRTAEPAVPTSEIGGHRPPLQLFRQFEKIGEDLFAAFGQDRFGVELDAPDGVLFVTDSHDFAFGFGFGGDLEGVRDGVALDEE